MRAGLLVLAGLLPAACASYVPQPEDSDRYHMMRALQNALEDNGIGKVSRWLNSSTGHFGTATPIRNYNVGSYGPCRDFEETLTENRTTGYRAGTGCRTDDGVWQIVKVTAFRRHVGKPWASSVGEPDSEDDYDKWTEKDRENSSGGKRRSADGGQKSGGGGLQLGGGGGHENDNDRERSSSRDGGRDNDRERSGSRDGGKSRERDKTGTRVLIGN